ncbi:reverse transcriptase family protein [Methylocapsa polymorpha]|uniref:RNA-directed DNA polymerase n=1 Tax=Methylocapsa polymorpha TaxID=3080828 RepID=A0ABZ0HU18_9HYPH|nr:reverse transcriptase family protein [Methylocapsa sp. RX1]
MSLRNDFTRLQNESHLLTALGIGEEAFREILAFDPSAKKYPEISDSWFQVCDLPPFICHEIPKKNRRRGFRTVWEPTSQKNIYKSLARRLNEFLGHKLNGFPHPRTFGYIGGRNIRENAAGHCGHRHLVSVDILDFFPSIRTTRVRKCLETTGIVPTVADLLSRFVTIDDSLALGLPTSPTLANAICLPLDIDLAELARQYPATYSRYADDISFSGDGELPSLATIKDAIQSHGFEIAEPKTRISKLGQSHYVTGLSVTDKDQPHVPRQKKRRLRQELYYTKKFGIDEHFHHLGINDPRMIQVEVNRLDGLVKFTAFHEPRLASSLKTLWVKILQDSGYSPSFEPKNQNQIPFYIFIDEAEYAHPDNKCILALAMSASQHQDLIHQATEDVLKDALADMYAAGNRDAIAKRGLHFVDAHPDLRKAFIERMRCLPFEGYVAMATLPSPAEYQSTYIRLLNAMIKRRLMAAESQFVYLVFEKNSKVNQTMVRDVVKAAYATLKAENNRHPKGYAVEFSGKPNPNLSVPDFLLGTLGQFLLSRPDVDESCPNRNRKLFESLRDKYRLILDADTWTEYSRRREIASWHQVT